MSEKEVERIESWLTTWGAASVRSYGAGRKGTGVDFYPPFPGDQPIGSSIYVDDGAVVEATVRYGVLDGDEFDGHPTGSFQQTRRITRAVSRADPPVGPIVLANYGDTHRKPRPHILIGWNPTVAEEREVVSRGSGHYPLDPEVAVGFIRRVGREYREEFGDQYVGE